MKHSIGNERSALTSRHAKNHFSNDALYFGNIGELSVSELVSGVAKWAPRLRQQDFNTTSDFLTYLNSPQGIKDKNAIKSHLGGKAWSLLEMSLYAKELNGISDHPVSVPTGFTLFTDHCQDYKEGITIDRLWSEIQCNIRYLESDSNKKFGGEPPLIVSVRSGAAVSLPGAMETILNIGLTRETLPAFAKEVGDLVAWDSYCRLLEGYGSSIFGISLDKFKNVSQKSNDKTLEAIQKKAILFEGLIKNEGFLVPKTPHDQLKGAIDCVFKSWNSQNAEDLLLLEDKNRNDFLGTAVTVQQQVFGNKENSFTGVFFSRDKLTGEHKVTGSIIESAQGSDIVSGAKRAHNINKETPITQRFSSELSSIKKIANFLKQKNNDIDRDIEITFDNDNGIYLLQDRSAKMSGIAELKSAIDFYHGNIQTLGEKKAKEQALLRVSPDKLSQLFLPVLSQKTQAENDFNKKFPALGDGVKSSLGCVQGIAVFSIKEVKRLKAKAIEEGVPIPKMILVVDHPYQETVGVAKDVEGLITQEGSPTSHALLYYGNCGKPFCTNVTATIKDFIKEGETITLNSNNGHILKGAPEVVKPFAPQEFYTFMGWVHEALKENDFEIWSTTGDNNAVKEAKVNGASGVGVYKVEDIISKMKADNDKIYMTTEDMVVASLLAKTSKRFDSLLDVKLSQFENNLKDYMAKLYRDSKNFPVGIRLFDPVITELLPEKESERFEHLVQRNALTPGEQEALRNKMTLRNPTLGVRGAHNIVSFRKFYEANIRAVFRAAKENGVCPRITIPFVSQVNELMMVRSAAETIAKELGLPKYEFGMMVETSTAYMAHKTPEFVALCDFFYVGPSDSTEKLLAISRDDSVDYITKATSLGVYSVDPLTKLHPDVTRSLQKVMKLVNAIKDGEREIVTVEGAMPINVNASKTALMEKADSMIHLQKGAFPNLKEMVQSLTTDKSDFKVMIGGRHATNGKSIEALVDMHVFPSVSSVTLHKNALTAVQTIISRNRNVSQETSRFGGGSKLWAEKILITETATGLRSVETVR